MRSLMEAPPFTPRDRYIFILRMRTVKFNRNLKIIFQIFCSFCSNLARLLVIRHLRMYSNPFSTPPRKYNLRSLLRIFEGFLSKLNSKARCVLLQGEARICLRSDSSGDYMMAMLRVMWEQGDNFSLAFVVRPDRNMTAILPKAWFRQHFQDFCVNWPDT